MPFPISRLSSELSRAGLLLAVLVGASAPGCGGAQFDGRVFRNDEVAFRVGPVPSSWREVDASHALIAFRDDRNAATIAVNGRCGKDADDVPLKSLTHHLFLHFTEREIESENIVPMDGREALQTELVAKLDGVPKRFTVYVLKKDGCVYDFMRIADNRGAGGGEQFAAFVRGFATLE